MLDMKSLSDVMKFWSKNIVFASTASEKVDFANDTLSKLYAMIHANPIINYYLEQSKELYY
jgi:cell fate regulator YaaT (PSP1 superfamily)